MKKINTKLAMVLPRGIVAMSGITCTLTVMLFITNYYCLFITAVIGVSVVMLLDKHIKSLIY